MEIIRPDGHLSDEALMALTDGRLDELSRLECAEHLGYCDECLMRYTALAACTSEAPPLSCQAAVRQKIRSYSVSAYLRRMGTAVAAVGIAAALWAVGIFGGVGDMLTGGDTVFEKQSVITQALYDLPDKCNGAFDKGLEGLNNVFDFIGGSAPTYQKGQLK